MFAEPFVIDVSTSRFIDGRKRRDVRTPGNIALSYQNRQQGGSDYLSEHTLGMMLGICWLMEPD